MIARIAILGSPVRKVFDYTVPDNFQVSIGQRVIVDFANRLVTGIVVATSESSKISSLKPVEDIVDFKPYLSGLDVELAKITSNYFLSPIGKILEASFPPNMRFKIKEILVKRAEIVPGFLKDEKSVSKDDFLKRFPDRKKGLKVLSELINLGTVDIYFSYPYSKKLYPKRKQVKKVRLNVDFNILLKNRKINKKRMEIINYLLVHEEAELSRLKKELNLKDTRLINLLKNEGILKIEEELSDEEFLENYKISLTKEQLEISKKIKNNQEKHYLFGVTGSGKTEIYFDVIEEVLKSDRNVLYLVPEISLTPQMIHRMKMRFPEFKIAIYHSNLKPRERFLEWLKVVNNEAQILLGTRSAVWLPIKNLGLVIIDEEHDESYYQKEMEPVYDAVKVAEWKSELNNAKFVIGSATPSVSRFFIASQKDFMIHYLRERPYNSKLPDVEVIDMRKEQKYNWLFSKKLVEEIDKTVREGKQVFLFTNRKGFFSYIICQNCGYVYKCKNCDVSMTFHYSIRALKCHYCGHLEAVPAVCPICKSKELSSKGFGTEKVESEILRIFPDFRVIRMDRDNVKDLRELEEILKLIKENQVDVVVGTKMITKGLDFPNVTLVGIISADQLLNFPDYTASERTFEMINQVAGRSGRGAFEGKVLIQTYNPETSVINFAVNHDYFDFFKEELKSREKLHYPPFSDIVNITVENISKEKAEELALKLFNLLSQGIKGELLGPVEALIFKLRNKYRYNLILKTDFLSEDIESISRILDENNFWSMVKILVNPPNLF